MTIHQDVTISAKPAEVYALLTNSERFSRMTGGREATISSEAGGPISLYGGHLVGRNIELVPGKRVVQAWRSKDWPEGVYSIVRFELSAEGKGTKIALHQAGHPADAQAHLEEGWHKMYWKPMQEAAAKTEAQ